MRQAVGIAAFFGMLGVTLFGLMFTPIFYVAVRRLTRAMATVPAEQAHQIKWSRHCEETNGSARSAAR